MKIWQDQDEDFYIWLDEYLESNNLASFEDAGDYGHVDIIELRQRYEERE